jgi:hypothetical protein
MLLPAEAHCCKTCPKLPGVCITVGNVSIVACAALSGFLSRYLWGIPAWGSAQHLPDHLQGTSIFLPNYL